MTTGYPMRCGFGCDGEFSNAKKLRQHYDAFHVGEYTPKPRRKPPVVKTNSPVTIAPPEPAPVEREPWTADDIVLPVIAQLAQPGNVIPVASLAALFAWRDATTTMLRDVLHTP